MAYIAASDIGHGHTKAYGGRVGLRAEDVPETRISFPSLAQPVAPGRSVGGLADDADVVTVPVAGVSYRTGVDIVRVASPGLKSIRHGDYCKTREYQALVCAALAYLDVPDVVDLLMLGLPLTTYERLGEHLEAKDQIHQVPLRGRRGGAHGHGAATRDVLVRQSMVMPQPSGALFDAARRDPQLLQARLLTLDLGYGTLDALVSIGLRAYPERSMAVTGGMAAYIDALQASVSNAARERGSAGADFRVSPSIYERALCAREPAVELAAGRFELAPHLTFADAILSTALRSVASDIGEIADIRAVVLAGGGTPVLRRVVPEVFPEIRAVVAPDEPQMAIARGMWHFGAQWLLSAGEGAQDVGRPDRSIAGDASLAGA